MQCSSSETRTVPLPGCHDVLTDLLRQGAQKLLSQAIEASTFEGQILPTIVSFPRGNRSH